MILFGNTEVSIRTLSLFFHLGTTVLIYLLAAKLIKSKIVSLIIAFATLINPFLLQYAFEARAYSMVVFLSVLSLYFVKTNKNLLAGAFLAMAIFTHNFAVLTFFIVIVWWLIANRKNFNKKEFLKLVCFPVIIMLLWGGVIFAQWSKFKEGFWIPRPTLSSFSSTFKIFTSGELHYSQKLIILYLSRILFVTSIMSFILKLTKEKNSFIWLIIGLIFIPVIATFIFSQYFTPIYYERYLILSTPLLILFIGYTLYNFLQKNSLLRTGLTILLAFYLLTLGLSSIEILNKQTKADIKSGVLEITKQAKEGDIIIPKNSLNFLEVKYYAEKSSRDIPVYAHAKSGKVPFYIGGILYEKQDIVKTLPVNKRIWQIEPNGRYELIIL